MREPDAADNWDALVVCSHSDNAHSSNEMTFRALHCPQHHRLHSHVCGEEGLRDFAREFQKDVDNSEDDDVDEHHPCDCLLG